MLNIYQSFQERRKANRLAHSTIMQFGPHLSVEQKLYLAPQMQYTLNLLQMSTDTLLDHLLDQAMENPLIALDSVPIIQPPRRPLDDEMVQDIPDRNREQTLQAHLIRQVPLSLAPELEWTVKQLIDSLEPTGYLSENSAELAKGFGVPQKLLDTALSLLHNMDPPGVGAANLEECLLLQLNRHPDAPPLARCIIQEHLHDASAGRLRKIAREKRTSLQSIEEAFAYIQTLSPFPASGFHSDEKATYVVPDIFVTCEDSQISIHFTEQAAPQLSRNATYMDLLSSTDIPDLRRYLRERSNALNRLEQALLMRNKTLLEVTEVIINRQIDFFIHGPQELQPLSLKEISDKLGLHVSTVSRAIQHRYLSCQWGVFPLRLFLSRYIPGKKEGTPAIDSQAQALRVLRMLIETEDPAAPLSDQQLFQQLLEQGVPVSRRSVANYREKLGIPSSYVRKRKVTP